MIQFSRLKPSLTYFHHYHRNARGPDQWDRQWRRLKTFALHIFGHMPELEHGLPNFPCCWAWSWTSNSYMNSWEQMFQTLWHTTDFLTRKTQKPAAWFKIASQWGWNCGLHIHVQNILQQLKQIHPHLWMSTVEGIWKCGSEYIKVWL